jgi:Tfp pilus assembly protein PilX
MNAMPARRSQRQRGVAALFVVAMLCFVMVLVAALAQRNVLVEELRSANELR